MAELTDLLNLIGEGTLDVKKAAPKVAALIRANSQAPASGYLEREERALEDKDGTNTFTEVAAANVAGTISDEQYKVLFDAVTGG